MLKKLIMLCVALALSLSAGFAAAVEVNSADQATLETVKGIGPVHAKAIIDERTESWGVKVISVEVKDVLIPPALENAMSMQAQAERERQARVILGDSERQIAVRERAAGADLVVRASARMWPSRGASVTPVSAARVGAISAGVTSRKYSPG